MTLVNKSACALSFYGDDLDPEEVSRLLGRSPSRSWRKGDPMSRHDAVRKTGLWSLVVEDRVPADLDAQIVELLGSLTVDLIVWQNLSRYRPRIGVGLFMKKGNEEFELEAETLKLVSDRSLRFWFDIYDPVED